MAISLSQNPDEPFSEMNTTPLIDVMLVLLIIFIITLPIMTHSVNLNVGTGAKNAVELKPISIEIDFDGVLTLDGSEVSSLAELETYLRAEGQQLNRREVHVRADRHAKYDTVAKVLAIAQRSGLRQIGIEGND